MGTCHRERERELKEKTQDATMIKVPRRRFGRTNLMMPVISCGGMRLQETWVPHDGFGLKDVRKDTMENMTKTIRAALASGINHFETAQGYGCSEIQFCAALGELVESGEVKREDFIFQTKIIIADKNLSIYLFSEKINQFYMKSIDIQ